MEKNSAGNNNRARPEYSIKIYLAVLIIVVLCVVILSYFAQRRNSVAGQGDALPAYGEGMCYGESGAAAPAGLGKRNMEI